jgi:hypothetical protein
MKIKELKLYMILIISSLILSATHLFRYLTNKTFPLYEQYQYLTPKFFLYNFILEIFNSEFLLRIVPTIFGIINVILLYYILQKFVKKKLQLFLTISVYVFSPVFIYIHTTINNLFLPVFFFLIALLFLLNHKYFLSLIGLLISVVLNQLFILPVLILLLVTFEKNKSDNSFIPILSILLSTYLVVSLSFPEPNISIHQGLLNLVSDLGSNIGLGLFSIVISLFGLIISWQKKNNNVIIYVSLFSFLFAFLTENLFIVFINFIMAYYAGLAIYTMIKSKWDSELLKTYVIILVFCGLIFSTGSYIKRISDSGPFSNEIESLIWLKDNNDGSMVLSDYQYGFMIQKFTNLNTYTDLTYYKYSTNKEKISKTNKLYNYAQIKDVAPFLKKENIKYIWINEEMKKNIWNNKEKGLLLVLKNSPSIKKIYDYQGIEIYEFTFFENI